MFNEAQERKIITTILRYKINQSIYSLEEIARKINRSKQNLSQIINGKVLFNPTIVQEIFTILDNGKRYDFSWTTQERVYNVFEECLNEYCYAVSDNYIQQLDKYLSEEMFYSNACPEYLILSCLSLYKKKDYKKLEECFYSIENGLKEMFTFEHLQFYSILKAEYEYSYQQHRKALETIQPVLLDKNANSCLNGIACFYGGLCYLELHDIYSAMTLLNKAEEYCTKSNCYARVLAIGNALASCYRRINKYALAIEKWQSVLKDAKRLNRNSIVNACYANLAFVYRDLEMYKESVDMIQQMKFSVTQSQYITLAWDYYYLNEPELCIEAVNQLKEFGSSDEYYQLMAELIECYLKNESTELKTSILKKLIEQAEKDESYADVIFNIKMLIKEYEKVEDYKNVAKYQKILMQIPDNLVE